MCTLSRTARIEQIVRLTSLWGPKFTFAPKWAVNIVSEFEKGIRPSKPG